MLTGCPPSHAHTLARIPPRAHSPDTHPPSPTHCSFLYVRGSCFACLLNSQAFYTHTTQPLGQERPSQAPYSTVHQWCRRLLARLIESVTCTLETLITQLEAILRLHTSHMPHATHMHPSPPPPHNTRVRPVSCPSSRVKKGCGPSCPGHHHNSSSSRRLMTTRPPCPAAAGTRCGAACGRCCCCCCCCCCAAGTPLGCAG